MRVLVVPHILPHAVHRISAQTAIGERVAQDLGAHRLAVLSVIPRTGQPGAVRRVARLEGLLRDPQQPHDVAVKRRPVGVADEDVIGDGDEIRRICWVTQERRDAGTITQNASSVASRDRLENTLIPCHRPPALDRAVRRGAHGVQVWPDLAGKHRFRACGKQRRIVGEPGKQRMEIGLAPRIQPIQIRGRQNPLVSLGVVLHHRRVADHLLQRQMQESVLMGEPRAKRLNCRQRGRLFRSCNAELQIERNGSDRHCAVARESGRPRLCGEAGRCKSGGGAEKETAVHGRIF